MLVVKSRASSFTSTGPIPSRQGRKKAILKEIGEVKERKTGQ
jgi:hypothetical protein